MNLILLHEKDFISQNRVCLRGKRILRVETAVPVLLLRLALNLDP